MLFTSSFVTLGFFVASALSAPTALHTIETYAGETTGRHIVTLKAGVDKTNLINQVKQNATVTHEFDIINGFAGHLDEDTLNALRASPDVESIAEDGIMHTMVTQTNAPWGISRLSSSTRLSNQNTNDADGNGHGTHCSGTAAGSQFGVAKSANLIAVKVLSDAGSGAVSDIVSGLSFVQSSARSSGRPSVASMSLGGGASTALDSAVASLTGSGVHLSVAAGNDGADAGNTSPARAPSANTVGATTIADARASFSNFGSVVDVFAPGQNVISAWIGSTTATNNISGTSMATPHVAGLIAYLISVRGNMSPASMSTLLKSLSLKGVISGVPSGTLNDLVHNA
ncbi:Subtilisin-like serine protease pepC [Leucoagaricus sp. SymC.cos]|nr:Subtilisin-like serine protease pepC [Leucoagaricus sp. SymC.cos]